MPISGLMEVMCTRSDGETVTATLTFNPATGAMLSATVVNTAAEAVDLIVTRSNGQVVRSAAARKGTRTYTAQQMAALGLDTIADLSGLTVGCV